MNLKFLIAIMIGCTTFSSSPTLAQSNSSSPREVYTSNQSLRWQQMPIFNYTNSDLGYQNRHFNCLIYANQNDDITHVEIVKVQELIN